MEKSPGKTTERSRLMSGWSRRYIRHGASRWWDSGHDSKNTMFAFRIANDSLSWCVGGIEIAEDVLSVIFSVIGLSVLALNEAIRCFAYVCTFFFLLLRKLNIKAKGSLSTILMYCLIFVGSSRCSTGNFSIKFLYEILSDVWNCRTSFDHS